MRVALAFFILLVIAASVAAQYTFTASIVDCTLWPATSSTSDAVGGHCQVLGHCGGEIDSFGVTNWQPCLDSMRDFISNLTVYGGTTVVGFMDFNRRGY